MVSITVERDKVTVHERISCCGYGSTYSLEGIKVKDILKLLYCKIVYSLKERLKQWTNSDIS